MFQEESESRLNSGGMILELHETDSIKLDFDLEPVNIALTTCVSTQFKSTSKSSVSANTSGQENSTQGICFYIAQPTLIFDGKVVVGQFGNPSLTTSI